MIKSTFAVFLTLIILSYSWVSSAKNPVPTPGKIISSKFISSLIHPCNCTEPGMVFVACDDNSWDSGTDFEHFTSDSGTPRVKSFQNGHDEALCYGQGELIETEGRVMVCPSAYGSARCNSFCTSQISTSEATDFTDELQECVSHFSAKCNSTVTVEGNYDANEFSADGWWVPYGLCDIE